MADHARELLTPADVAESGYSSAIRISCQTDIVTVTLLKSRLDEHTAPVFLSAVAQVLQDWLNVDLILDFSHVLDMDSHGLAAIIQIFKTILGRQRKLTICGVNDRLQELFRITMLDQTLGAHYRPGQSLH